MPLPFSTKNSVAVEAAVQGIYREMFPSGDTQFLPMAFDWTRQCFEGRYPNYQAIDAAYHDLEHTLQGTLCMARLLRTRHLQRAEPVLDERMLQLGLTAILFHDTGYLKRQDDIEGTGAKYTLTHVLRSIDFAEGFLLKKGFTPVEIHAVQHMIRCTGVNFDLTTIPFQSALEQVIGFALGTADLLGQMAAEDYIDKLPILFLEFEESQNFNAPNTCGMITFSSARDLMGKTPLFWKNYVWPKINSDFKGLYQFLNDPFPDGPNFYLDAIRANLAQLEIRLRVA